MAWFLNASRYFVQVTNAIDRHMLEVNTTQIVVFYVQRFLKYLHKLLRLGILPHSTLLYPSSGAILNILFEKKFLRTTQKVIFSRVRDIIMSCILLKWQTKFWFAASIFSESNPLFSGCLIIITPLPGLL